MDSILGPAKIAEITRLAREVAQKQVPGAVAECGVYKGGVLGILAEIFPSRPVYGFDTFTGLPKQDWTEDEKHSAGDFADTWFDVVQGRMAGYGNVILREGYFPGTAEALEHEQFCFVHLDFDFYAGTRAALDFFLPRMPPHAVMVLDDVDWRDCPGVRQAISASGIAVEQTVRYQAMYRKP